MTIKNKTTSQIAIVRELSATSWYVQLGDYCMWVAKDEWDVY